MTEVSERTGPGAPVTPGGPGPVRAARRPWGHP
jgi:hypothetical protein